jgi:alpha-ketoglutarate-dependent taurine dioxygenase
MMKPQARDLHPALGAEITGVDLSRRLDLDTVQFLRKVFDDREAIVFRDAEIDRAYQYYLVDLLLGHEPPTEEEAAAGAARQGRFMISNKEPEAAAPSGRLLYHCDGMWSDEPYEVLSLHAVDVEPPVAPTQLVSATHAWSMLPSDLRARVEGLHALHVPSPEYIHERRRAAFEGQLIHGTRGHMPVVTAPVAHRHPRTGRTILYVTQGMTREIMELPSEASEDLLEELFAQLYAPERVYEHEWREGDLLIWDNLATQHGRPYVTLEGATRTFNKIGLPAPTDIQKHLIQSYQRVA